MGSRLILTAFAMAATCFAAEAQTSPPSWFLKDCKDPGLRTTLFDLYKKSEAEVRLFATYGNWRDIQQVEVMTDAIRQKTGAGALWGVTNGRVIIHIPADANDRGVIFYEMFHGAFDHSPLESQHDKWAADAGAAWCNAFRYFMEARYVPESPWLAGFNTRMAAGPNLIIGPPNPDLILFYCRSDYARFKTFWKERQAHPYESLDAFFVGHIKEMSRTITDESLITTSQTATMDTLDAPGTSQPDAASTQMKEFSDLAASLNSLSEYRVNRGNWRVGENGKLVGSGDSEADFKHPLPGNCTLEFKMSVIDGMRPRIFFRPEGDLYLGNEGYIRTIYVYGSEIKIANGAPALYASGSVIAVKVRFTTDTIQLWLNGHMAAQGSRGPTETLEFRLAGGDGWSPGTTAYWGFTLSPAP